LLRSLRCSRFKTSHLRIPLIKRSPMSLDSRHACRQERLSMRFIRSPTLLVWVPASIGASSFWSGSVVVHRPIVQVLIPSAKDILGNPHALDRIGVGSCPSGSFDWSVECIWQDNECHMPTGGCEHWPSWCTPSPLANRSSNAVEHAEAVVRCMGYGRDCLASFVDGYEVRGCERVEVVHGWDAVGLTHPWSPHTVPGWAAVPAINSATYRPTGGTGGGGRTDSARQGRLVAFFRGQQRVLHTRSPLDRWITTAPHRLLRAILSPSCPTTGGVHTDKGKRQNGKAENGPSNDLTHFASSPSSCSDHAFEIASPMPRHCRHRPAVPLPAEDRATRAESSSGYD
jgi:hypothetical protein